MTPLEKLRALAAAKKAAEAGQVVESKIEAGELSPTGRNPTQPAMQELPKNENVSRVTTTESTEVPERLPSIEAEQGLEVCATEDKLLEPGDKEDREGSLSTVGEPDPGSISRLEEDHPLKMQLAELEQALTEKLPEFRTILRDIHAKLRQDPDCVTAMSEDEIGSIVQGLIHHANVDVIAPRAVKSAKKASKVPVSASDL